MQCLMTVEVPPPEEDVAVKTEPSASSSSAGKKPATPASAGPDGKICFLGNITRKLVITPNYELGSRRSVTSDSENGRLSKPVSMNNLAGVTSEGAVGGQAMDEEVEDATDEALAAEGGGYVDYE